VARGGKGVRGVAGGAARAPMAIAGTWRYLGRVDGPDTSLGAD